MNILKEYSAILRKKNIWIICLSLCLLLSSLYSWYFLLPIYLKKLGANTDQVGTAYLIFDITFCLLQMPGGLIADRLGRRRILLYPTFLLSILFIMAGLSRNWLTITVLIGLSNLIQGIQFPAVVALVGESVNEKERSMAFSLMETALASGFALGPLIGFFVIRGNDNIGNLMILTGILMIPCALMRLGLKDSANHEDFNVNIREVTAGFNRNLILLMFSFIFFGLMLASTLYGPFITLYAGENMKMPDDTIQLMFMAGGFATVLFNIFSGKLASRIGPRYALTVGMLGHSLIFLPWLASGNHTNAIIMYVFTYIFLQLSYIGHSTILTELTEIRTRSSMMGIFGMVPGIIGALAPKIETSLLPRFGPGFPFCMGISFAVISCIFLIPIKLDRD